MKASHTLVTILQGGSLVSRIVLFFAFLCLLIPMLSGCSSGSGSSQLALPQAGTLPDACTSATIGSDYSCDIMVSGGSAPFSWTVSGLPSGLTSNADTDTTSTLTISGKPPAAVAPRVPSVLRPAGSSTMSSVQVGVTDSHHHVAHLSFTITVTAPAALTITTTSPLTGGTAGTAYSAMVTAAGGTTPYKWTITGLPSGLTLSSGTPSATISGTTDTVGTFSVMASVTDSAATPATVSATLSLTIAQAATLMISTTSLPGGTINVAYSQTLSANGGVMPYKWSLASGSLPAGMSISMAGAISGTSTATGTASFTVKVTDSESPAQTAMQALSIAINPAGQGLSITTMSPLSGASLGAAYSAMVVATGGTPPYMWRLGSSSVLPAGLSLTSGTPNATVGGTPTATGTFQFTLDVNDSAATPNAASASFLVTVTGSSTVSCPSPVNLTLCGTYSYGLQGLNGSNGPLAFGGTILVDSTGHVIKGAQRANDSVAGVTDTTITGGSYAMDSSGDGRGVLKVINSTASVTTFRFVLESAANSGPGPIIEFDSSGNLAEGLLVGPETPPLPQIPANTVLAIPISGVNGAGHLSTLLGEFEVGSNGCDGSSGSFNSREAFVTNTAGTVNTGLTATGSCAASNTNGIGTLQFTISGGTPFASNTLHFTYVVASGGTLFEGMLLLGTDSLAANQPILAGLADPNPNAGTVTGPAFASFCPCLFEGAATIDGTSSGKSVASIVRVLVSSPGSGSSGTVSGIVDENAGGSLTMQGTWPYSAFTIDADGSGTFTGTGQKTIHFILGNVLYTLDESAQVRTGSLNGQNALSVGNPNMPYIFGADEGAIGRAGGARVSGVLTPSGATSGTLGGTADAISSAGSIPGVAVSGSYSSISATTGRGTGTASLTGGSPVNIVIYAFRNRRILMLDMQSTNPFLTGARLQ